MRCCFLLCCYSREKDNDSKLLSPFSLCLKRKRKHCKAPLSSFMVVFQWKRRWQLVAITFFSGDVATKKAMACYYCLFFCVWKEKDYGNVSSSSSMMVLQWKKQRIVVTFFYVFEEKKTTPMCRHLLLWWCCSDKGNGSRYHHLLLCVWKEEDDDNAPSSSFVEVLQRRR